PIGSCALAGTTYPADRLGESLELGFDGICDNSIDGVSDRDFVIEFASALSLIMTHLSRFSEEIILWSSWEFGFIRLDDAYTTGSSIMPQKKNPDMAELVRGKTGRVYGDLMSLLTVMKGLPLAYDKDMQEDKEAIFDACDTVSACLEIFAGMIPGICADRKRMREAAEKGFINATDLADYIVSLGIPFRTAYKLSGRLVEVCAGQGLALSDLPLDEYRKVCPEIDERVYREIDLDACVSRRSSPGGTSPVRVAEQIASLREKLRPVP
ncbi:MAG: argininosuccinate lyase, partial [Clostridia bacterium]|nr:argininosuccinate lyase [Clostridia bacterium]